MSDESRRNRENITGNPEHVEGEIRKATKPTAVTPLSDERHDRYRYPAGIGS